LKIPARVWSQLGSVDVRHEPGMIENNESPAFGRWSGIKREITIDPAACEHTQLATLFHEITHIALWDAGGENVLTEAQTEYVCDALGAYLAGSALGGFLALRVPRE
jgi:hypothetical protein